MTTRAENRPDLLKSSGVMAVGTAVSRATGFVRTVVLAAAIGTQLLGDAYHTANTIPFIVYDLLIGGLMASVIVPFLVKRRKQDPDGGAATEQRLFTLAAVLLLIVSVIAVLSAEWLIRLYAGEFTEDQFNVAVLLARFLLAQIFFLGMSGLSSAMLNARGRFGAPVWAPVLNNLTIIAVGAVFLATTGPGSTPEEITEDRLALLGVGTAGAMALQALVLQLALHAAGFRWRLRFDVVGSGLGEALRAAGWMFVLVCTMQVGFLVTANIANRAGVAAATGEAGVGAGLTAYHLAYQLFQLPYAILAVSVITVLLPRMSSSAADGNRAELRRDFSRGLRTVSTLLVPVSLLMAVYAVPLCAMVLARGSTSEEDARMVGQILRVFALGLVSFSIYQLMLRVFYASGDTRTPALIGIANVAVHTAAGTAAFHFLPAHRIVVGVAAGFMLSYICGLLIGGLVLRRRLKGIDGRRILRTLVLLHLAAVPLTAVGAGTLQAAYALPIGSTPAVLIGAVAALALGGPLFGFAGRMLGIREIPLLVHTLRSRLPRRLGGPA